MIDLLRSLRGVRVACMLREQDGEVRGSFRSKDDTDVAAIAGEFGGGGHQAAAGFTIHDDLRGAVETVARRLGIAGAPTDAGGARGVKRGRPICPWSGRGQAERHDLPRCGEPRPAHLRREAHRAHGHLRPHGDGVLPICVGPATRLDAFLTGHDKSYVVSVAFGAATATDDADGEVIRTGVVPDEVFDPFFASVFVGGLVAPASSCRRCTRPSRWGEPRPAMRLARGALSIWRRATSRCTPPSFWASGAPTARNRPSGHGVPRVEGHLYSRARP